MRILTCARQAKPVAAIAAIKLRWTRPRKEGRRTMEAIIWRLDNGANGARSRRNLELVPCLPAFFNVPLLIGFDFMQDH
jgi:hypothetical protein